MTSPPHVHKSTKVETGVAAGVSHTLAEAHTRGGVAQGLSGAASGPLALFGLRNMEAAKLARRAQSSRMHVTAIAATHASLLSLPHPGRDGGSRLSSPDSQVGICSSTYLDPLVTLGLLPLRETGKRKKQTRVAPVAAQLEQRSIICF